ncbi:Kei1p [Lachancea thermotolerans CBS 6340]|uniref:KLTH0F16082p n=1 Tax=Lachancea thermotolerans (strain ATCC 56472 / CBS 6340 / NRRL Y-8284) TaxID=559295 RepID=C5DJF9_LACTC|nr:KLTH0F16082p [Lachancea thermotolerans CBS 6340]CAR24448.1 KLTH0F16082p [Lachancea thermotolerans CBS 6340]
MGVEIGLGITILNKCSGFYGILGLLTGHQLDFMQWVLYLTSVFTLVVYSLGLTTVYKPKLQTYAFVLLTFTADTLITCFFTLWFSGMWFAAKESELSDPSSATQQTSGGISSGSKLLTARGETLSSQSASQATEYFFTILVSLIALVSRFYFNFIILAFVQRLFRHPKYLVDQDDVDQDLKHKKLWQRWWIRAENWSYRVCHHYLA